MFFSSFFFLMYKLLCSYRNIKKVKISHIFLLTPLSVESLMRMSDLTVLECLILKMTADLLS